MSSPAPAAATSSSPSSSRMTAASASSSVAAWRTTSSSTAAGCGLGGEQRAGARQLLGEASCAPLGLEQLAPLERAAGGTGEVARELEVVVGEVPFLREEDEHERALVRARRLDRDGQQRAVAALARNLAPLLVEAFVVLEPRRGEHAPVARGPAQRPGRIAEPVLEELHEQTGETVETVQPEIVVSRHQHGRAGATERVRGRLRERVVGVLAEIGWPSTAAIR